MARTDILEQKDKILQWIEEHRSKAFIAKQLHCKEATLNSYLKKMDIEYDGNKGSKGFCHDFSYKSAEEYSQKESGVKSHILKLKLIKDGIKKDECEICKNSIWQGVKLPLELHHKDGNHYNNNFDNLQILCPNCHSIQEGNCGRKNKKKESIKTNKCSVCGKLITNQASTCKDCYNKSRQICKRPDREELKEMIRNESFVSLGKKFNVSDKAIVKWCIIMNLPSKKKEINSYTDEEWEKI